MLAQRGLYQTRVEQVRRAAPFPVESLHQPVRRRPYGDHPRWGAGEYTLLEAESAIGRCELEEAGWRRVSCE